MGDLPSPPMVFACTRETFAGLNDAASGQPVAIACPQAIPRVMRSASGSPVRMATIAEVVDDHVGRPISS